MSHAWRSGLSRCTTYNPGPHTRKRSQALQSFVQIHLLFAFALERSAMLINILRHREKLRSSVRLIPFALDARTSETCLIRQQTSSDTTLHIALASPVRSSQTTVSIGVRAQQQISPFLNKTLDYHASDSVRVAFVCGMRIESRSNCAFICVLERLFLFVRKHLYMFSKNYEVLQMRHATAPARAYRRARHCDLFFYP